MASPRRPQAGGITAVSTFSNLPEYMISNFFPSLKPFVDGNPLAFRVLGLVLAVWYFNPLSKLQALWSQSQSLLVSTINVNSEEDLFEYLITYLADAKTLRADQSLNAHSNQPRDRSRMQMMRGENEESNRRATANLEPPKLKYEQTEGTQLFVYKRRLFWATRKKGEGSTFTRNGYRNVELLSLSTLGRSTSPIKNMLQTIFETNKDKERASTIIRRPFDGGYGGRLAWSRITTKPRRALDTVILKKEKKELVLSDIEEYISEDTSLFYGRHGIPYRRGYLFYGPPGVGKTSFALAIANKFNLDVYVLNLTDASLSDSSLISLLNQLPGRSLLLLEDIDTAGLTSRKATKTSKPPAAISSVLAAGPGGRRRGGRGASRGKGTKSTEKSATTDATADSDDEELSTSTKVSLSGLLNAIDGVAAPEGHILIMTTNKPEMLDEALVRAGRISVRVKFENASSAQAREIFQRMYVDLPAAMGTGLAATSPAAQATGLDASIPSEGGGSASDEKHPPIETLAETFANTLPEYEFSPADLQDYLLIHKKNPQSAIAELDAWIVKTREQQKEREEEREVERALRAEKKRVAEEGWKESIRGILKEEVGEADEADGEEGSGEKTEQEKEEGKGRAAQVGSEKSVDEGTGEEGKA